MHERVLTWISFQCRKTLQESPPKMNSYFVLATSNKMMSKKIYVRNGKYDNGSYPICSMPSINR